MRNYSFLAANLLSSSLLFVSCSETETDKHLTFNVRSIKASEHLCEQLESWKKWFRQPPRTSRRMYKSFSREPRRIVFSSSFAFCATAYRWGANNNKFLCFFFARSLSLNNVFLSLHFEDLCRTSRLDGSRSCSSLMRLCVRIDNFRPFPWKRWL